MNFINSLYKYEGRDTIFFVREMGARLMAGQQTLNLYVEVRLLCAQLFLFNVPAVSGNI